MTRIELLRDIVTNRQCKRIRIDGKKVYVDLFTASAACALYDALSEKARAHYIALSWPRFVSITFKLAAH